MSHFFFKGTLKSETLCHAACGARPLRSVWSLCSGLGESGAVGAVCVWALHPGFSDEGQMSTQSLAVQYQLACYSRLLRNVKPAVRPVLSLKDKLV